MYLASRVLVNNSSWTISLVRVKRYFAQNDLCTGFFYWERKIDIAIISTTMFDVFFVANRVLYYVQLPSCIRG